MAFCHFASIVAWNLPPDATLFLGALLWWHGGGRLFPGEIPFLRRLTPGLMDEILARN